jgi:hypothetical protein
MLRPRIPTNKTKSIGEFDTRILRMPRFYLISFSNILQGLVYFLPGIYLPGNTLLSETRIIVNQDSSLCSVVRLDPNLWFTRRSSL